MPDVPSRQLVIDASVVGPLPRERAEPCRLVRRAILEVCHKQRMTRAAGPEWKHATPSARIWRADMARTKDKWRSIDPPTVPGLREAIDAVAAAVSDEAHAHRLREDMYKDLHLIEAADDDDGIVISHDDRAGDLFAAVARQCPAIAHIMWVNPCRGADEVIAWLEAGAPRRPEYQLANRPHDSPR